MSVNTATTTTILHLLASPFYGGPERQVLGMAGALTSDFRSIFLSFAERGLAADFVEEARRRGHAATILEHNARTPLRAVREIVRFLAQSRADILITHGYKPDILGCLAARVARIPVVAVSRGWTAHTRKVRFNEAIDRRFLRLVDHVVCVSEGQRDRVLRCGVLPSRISVIRNSIDLSRFDPSAPSARAELEGLFAQRPSQIAIAAGRLSPEKGFSVLVEAATLLRDAYPDLGVLVFGDGPLRDALARQASDAGLAGRFVFAGFRRDLDRLLPNADLVVIPSFTEGLPNVALEACAARLPLVATAVGGLPEIVSSEENGLLVPPGLPRALADGIARLLADPRRARLMGEAGRLRVANHFGFTAQATSYAALLRRLLIQSTKSLPPRPSYSLTRAPSESRS